MLVLSITSFIVGLITLPFLSGGLHGLAWMWIFLASLTYILGNLFYFYALKGDEPSKIVPLFSLSLVFLAILSALFLGEIFNPKTYFGIFIIIVGSITITYRHKITDVFTSRSFWLMIMSCFCFAVTYVVNKYLLFSYNYWQVFGIQRILFGFLGLLLIIFFFSEIKQTYQQIKKKYLFLSGATELLNVVAVLLFTIATAYWYVTLAETVVSVHYIFIFFWALLISRFKPSLFYEEISRKIIFQKIIAIVLIIGGIFLIS